MRISLTLTDDDDDKDDDDNNANDKDNNDDNDDDDGNNLDLIPGSSLQEGGETEEDDLWTTWGKVRTINCNGDAVMTIVTIVTIMTIVTIVIIAILTMMTYARSRLGARTGQRW